MAFAASSGAQAPGSQTLLFEETEGKGRYIDEKPLSTRGGNLRWATRSPSATSCRIPPASCRLSARSSKSAGTRWGQLCNGVAKRSDGDLLLDAAFTEGRNGRPTIKGAITGGTGAYANARGTFTSLGEEVSTTTFVFTTG